MAEKKPEGLKQDELTLIRRHIGISLDVLEKFTREVEDKKSFYDLFQAFLAIYRKDREETQERLERIERLELLDRTGNSQSGEAREIKSEIRQEIESLEWQLSRHISNLGILELQAAGYGSLAVPLNILNEIAAEQEAIHRLQSRLKDRKQ